MTDVHGRRRLKPQAFEHTVAQDLMTPSPVVVRVTDNVGGVMEKLIESGVRHLPVVRDGALVGIVSDRDLQDALKVMFGGPERRKDHPWDRPVSAVMSSDVISVQPETEIGEVIDLMIDQKIGAIPVVEQDSLRVIGIVSYIDVLRAARELLS